MAWNRRRAPTWRYCARCGPETRAVKMQAVERWRRLVAGGEPTTLQQARGEWPSDAKKANARKIVVVLGSQGAKGRVGMAV